MSSRLGEGHGMLELLVAHMLEKLGTRDVKAGDIVSAILGCVIL
jgi:hypothetical protein